MAEKLLQEKPWVEGHGRANSQNPPRPPRVRLEGQIRGQLTVTRTDQIIHKNDLIWGPWGKKNQCLQMKERTGGQNKSPSRCGQSKRPPESGKR